MADDDTSEVQETKHKENEFDPENAGAPDEEFQADESVEALAEMESDDDNNTPKRPVKPEADEDEDDEDEDDIEADLGEILKDRIAAGDDDEDDDLPKPAPPSTDIAPKRSDEWTCEQCFFIVSTSQFGSQDEPRCPQGEDPCPSIARAFS